MRSLLLSLVVLMSCRSAAPTPVVATSTPPRLTFLGAGVLPKQDFQGAPVGGLSALSYDTYGKRYLALSDDRGEHAPARIYTLDIRLEPERAVNVSITAVLTLLNDDGKPFPVASLDPEGLAVRDATRALFSSEGIASKGIQPFVKEVNLATGQVIRTFELPASAVVGDDGGHGVRENYGLESLSICPGGRRAISFTEGVLAQDGPWPSDQAGLPSHGYVYDIETGALAAEWKYPLEPTPLGALVHGITTALCLDAAGEALVLERSWGVTTGFALQLFHARLKDGTFVKERVLDFGTLGVTLDNTEGMTLGPPLPDGRQLLLFISDDNFRGDQVTQVLAFAMSR